MTRDLQVDPSLRERVLDIAREALAGERDPLLACRDIAGCRAGLVAVADDIIYTFVGVASEIDDLPLGSEREQWSEEALRSKDLEAAEYRERVREPVNDALKRLLTALAHQH